MSSEILAVLEYMEKEKGISREDMIETISSAIKIAACKGEETGPEIRVEISPKTGTLEAWTLLEVVDFVADKATQILLEKARLYADDPKIGDVVERELEPSYLGHADNCDCFTPTPSPIPF